MKAATQPQLLFAFPSLCNRLLIAFIPPGVLKALSLFLSSAPPLLRHSAAPPLAQNHPASFWFASATSGSSSVMWRERERGASWKPVEVFMPPRAYMFARTTLHPPPPPHHPHLLPQIRFTVAAAISGGGDMSCRAEQFRRSRAVSVSTDGAINKTPERTAGRMLATDQQLREVYLLFHTVHIRVRVCILLAARYSISCGSIYV